MLVNYTVSGSDDEYTSFSLQDYGIDSPFWNNDTIYLPISTEVTSGISDMIVKTTGLGLVVLTTPALMFILMKLHNGKRVSDIELREAVSAALQTSAPYVSSTYQITAAYSTSEVIGYFYSLVYSPVLLNQLFEYGGICSTISYPIASNSEIVEYFGQFANDDMDDSTRYEAIFEMYVRAWVYAETLATLPSSTTSKIYLYSLEHIDSFEFEYESGSDTWYFTYLTERIISLATIRSNIYAEAYAYLTTAETSVGELTGFGCNRYIAKLAYEFNSSIIDSKWTPATATYYDGTTEISESQSLDELGLQLTYYGNEKLGLSGEVNEVSADGTNWYASYIKSLLVTSSSQYTIIYNTSGSSLTVMAGVSDVGLDRYTYYDLSGITTDEFMTYVPEIFFPAWLMGYLSYTPRFLQRLHGVAGVYDVDDSIECNLYLSLISQYLEAKVGIVSSFTFDNITGDGGKDHVTPIYEEAWFWVIIFLSALCVVIALRKK